MIILRSIPTFTTKLRLFSLTLLLGVVASMYACGGGGGGDTSAPAPTPTPAPPSVPKAWQGATLIEMDNAGNALEPKVSFDGSGNAMAVWLQSDGSRNNVMARRYIASTAQWGTVTVVDNLDVDALAPDVAMDASGNAIVVWSQLDAPPSAASAGNVWARRYTASTGTWGSVEPLEAIDGRADQVKIAIDAKGNAMVVWMKRKDFLVTNMWSRYFSGITGAWAATQLVETIPGDTSNPSIAFSAKGEAMAMWQQFDGARIGLFSNHYNAVANTWGASQPVDSGGTYGVSVAHLALQSNGNATAVWTQYDGTRANIKASRYSATAVAWSTPTIILDTTTGGNASAPRVAVDASGNAMAVWAQIHDNNSNNPRISIWSNTFTASTGVWGTATLVETDDTSNANQPQVAIDASGSATVVWEQAGNVWTRRVSAGQWSPATLLETDNKGDAGFPQLTVEPSGNAMAVWAQYDGTRYNIWANIFK
jgi:hypothetical protein